MYGDDSWQTWGILGVGGFNVGESAETELVCQLQREEIDQVNLICEWLLRCLGKREGNYDYRLMQGI